jgi:hypothetical protein
VIDRKRSKLDLMPELAAEPEKEIISEDEA